MALDVDVELNQQQLEIVEKLRHEQGGKSADDEVVTRAFRDYVEGRLSPDSSASAPAQETAASTEPPALEYGELRESLKLEPVTGIALPVHEGEVLRIVQEEDGGQCVDFNAFNINDYKERLDVGRTRAYHGLFPQEGAFIYTNSPRDRAMFEILTMPETCRAETLGARCNAVLFERLHGLALHTNCQDTLAVAIGAYGLTPDDVHDSFNLWMNTELSPEGNMELHRNTGSKGEYVDLLAIMDTVSVPIVCGSGDVMTTSNFALKSLRVEVYEATEATVERARAAQKQHNSFRNNRTAEDFKVSEIKADRPLRLDPDYEPDWVNFPLRLTTVSCDLSDEESKLLDEARTRDLSPGNSDGEILRSCAMLQYQNVLSERAGGFQWISRAGDRA